MPFRMFAVLFPISHRSNTSRTKMMLMVAWILGPLCALPQSFIFTIRSHPLVPDYHQCTSIGSFETSTLVNKSIHMLCWFFQIPIQELSYVLYVMTMTIIVPLVVMLISFFVILYMMYKRSKNPLFQSGNSANGSVIEKARLRTIKVAAILVLGFVLSWTPYYIMSIWLVEDYNSF